jgi:hypothetical protein
MQQYSSEIHGNYNSFSSRNLIMEKDKELECPEGPGGLIKKLKRPEGPGGGKGSGIRFADSDDQGVPPNMQEIFYKTFLKTTDPRTEYSALVSFEVIFCIFVNLCFYTGAYYILMKLFGFPKKITQVIIGLIIIMILGYIGRLARVKSMYNVLLETYGDEAESHEMATTQLRNAYFTWYFLS